MDILNSKMFPNLLDKKDLHFLEHSGVCESVAKQLRKNRVGASVNNTPIITPEEEALLQYNRHFCS